MKNIFFVTPSLTSGGAERVISELAIYFSGFTEFKVTVICLIKEEHFYKLPDNVVIVEPDFYHTHYSRLVFTYKIYRFLRNYLKKNKPYAQLSFGGKYNSFVLLASLGLNIKTYVSDRSRPTISYGKFLDRLNAVMYKKAEGIVAQTNKAKEEALKKTGNKNIKIIGNPIRQVNIDESIERQKLIVNAGRFIKSKHQPLLVEYFAKVNDGTWKLVFLGDGEYCEATKKRVKELGIEQFVEFAGTVKDIDKYYNKASIFAFTSTSEGFPNVLGEAMSAGLASISFDCVAGPSDLIEDGINGFLVEEMNHEEYMQKLGRLMQEPYLRKSFGEKARHNIQKFSSDNIGKEYMKFMTGQ